MRTVPPVLEPLAAVIRKKKREVLGWSVFLGTFGVAGLGVAPFAGEGGGAIFGVVGVVLGVAALAIGVGGSATVRDMGRVLDRVLDTPSAIVWVHAEPLAEKHIGGNIVRTRVLTMRTLGRELLTMDVADADVEGVLAALQAHLPHATFGFTEQREERFRKAPATFADAPDGGSPFRTGVAPFDREPVKPGFSRVGVAGGAAAAAGGAVGGALILKFMLAGARVASLGVNDNTPEHDRPPHRAPTSMRSQPAPSEASIEPASALIASDGEAVYYADAHRGVFMRRTAKGETVLATEPSEVRGIAATKDEVFYTTQRMHGLWRVPKRGGTPELVTSKLAVPRGVAVDGTTAYVAVEGGIAKVSLTDSTFTQTFTEERSGDAEHRLLRETIAIAPKYVYFDDGSHVFQLLRSGRGAKPERIDELDDAVLHAAANGTVLLIAPDPDDTSSVYALDEASGRITRLDACGDAKVVATDGRAAYSVDRLGVLAAVALDSKKVTVLATDKTSVAFLAVTEDAIYASSPAGVERFEKPRP